MPQFSGTLSTVGTTSFLNNTLLVSGGSPPRATAILTQAGCSSGFHTTVVGQAVLIGSTQAIDITSAHCTGVPAPMAIMAVPAPKKPAKKTKKPAVKKPKEPKS